MSIASLPIQILPNVGMPELIVIFLILLVLFGASRLAGIGSALGKTIREFRREVRDVDDSIKEERHLREDRHTRESSSSS
jgi:sec-independent protein translocase protein TatA